MKYLLLISSIIILPGCTHYQYAPSSHNVPLLANKHDFKASVQAYAADEMDGIEFQSAFAPIYKMGIMVNGFRVDSGEPDSSGESGRGGCIEGAVGYFQPLFDRHLIIELYGGMGRGKAVNYYTTVHSEAVFNKYFAQTALGLKTRFFEWALSARLGYLDYPSFNLSATTSSMNMPASITSLQAHRSSTVVEYGMTVRGGLEKLKVQLQLGTSTNLTSEFFPQAPAHMSLGVTLQLGPKKTSN